MPRIFTPRSDEQGQGSSLEKMEVGWAAAGRDGVTSLPQPADNLAGMSSGRQVVPWLELAGGGAEGAGHSPRQGIMV